MPAQAEEIEAAEREGIVVRRRPGADRGRRPRRRGRRPSAATSCARPTTAGAGGARDRWASVAARARAPRDHDPRRDRRGARPVDPPRGRRHRGQRLGRDRRRSRGRWPRAAPASSPAATSCPGRARSSRRSPPDAAPPRRSTSTSRAPPTAKREILAAVRYRDGARRRRSAARPRARPRVTRRAAGRDIRVVLGHGAGRLHRGRGRAEAGRCFRCDAVYGCPSVARHRRPGTGGRASAPTPTPSPSRRPGRRPASAGRCAVTPDQVSGFFDAGEGFIEGTIGAALVVLWLLAVALHLGRGVHGPQHRQVHAAARRRPVVDHLRRRCATSSCSRCSSAASSSSTPTS